MASFMGGNPALKATHQQLKTKMDSTVEDFRGHLLSARTGRANVHMLDHINVDYYGTDTPVAQMGQVSSDMVRTYLAAGLAPARNARGQAMRLNVRG